MNSRLRHLVTPVLLCTILSADYTAIAQSKSSKKAAEKTVTEKFRRLPQYFGQLKLDAEQKEAVYKIREEIGPKIAELEAEIAKLKEDEMEQCEEVLTATQKKTLTTLRDATGEKKATASKSSTSKKSGSKSSSKDDE